MNGASACCLPRRNLLSGFAALAASSLMPSASPAQSKPSRTAAPPHFVPPCHQVDARRQHLNDRATIAHQLEDMDKGGVALSVATVTVPELKLQDEQASTNLA